MFFCFDSYSQEENYGIDATLIDKSFWEAQRLFDQGRGSLSKFNPLVDAIKESFSNLEKDLISSNSKLEELNQVAFGYSTISENEKCFIPLDYLTNFKTQFETYKSKKIDFKNHFSFLIGLIESINEVGEKVTEDLKLKSDLKNYEKNLKLKETIKNTKENLLDDYTIFEIGIMRNLSVMYEQYSLNKSKECDIELNYEIIKTSNE